MVLEVFDLRTINLVPDLLNYTNKAINFVMWPMQSPELIENYHVGIPCVPPIQIYDEISNFPLHISWKGEKKKRKKGNKKKRSNFSY